MTSPYIAWLDLETDGKPDYRAGHILEVAVIVSDSSFNVLNTYEAVLGSNELVLNAMPDVVKQMHKDSGLWDETLESKLTLDEIDLELADFLDPYGPNIPFAGTGVLAYDKKWIDFWLIKSSRLLTYWGYDTGVIRRTLKNLTKFNDMPEKEEYVSGTQHRAFDDALGAMNEMNSYVDFFNRMKKTGE